MATKMPDFGFGYLGEQPKFKEYGLSTFNHRKPEISLVGNDVEIELGYKFPLKTLVALKCHDDNTERDDCVFVQTKTSEETIQILATIPKPGIWKLEIYAKPQSDPGDSCIGVYNYAIHCKTIIKKAYPYPKRYKQWSEGCYLYDPIILHRDVRGASVHFKVRIPKANDVAVAFNKQQDNWVHLKDELGRGIWEGNVSMAEYYGRNTTVTVNARFGADKGGTYATLLEYSGV